MSQHQPDLFIVYTGHNEFLENRTYSELIADPPSQRKLVATLSRTRTFSALHRMLRPPLKLDGKRFELPGEVDAVLDHTVGPDSYHRDDKLKKRIVKHFQFNMARMVQIARDAGAEIVFVTPASNLKDSSPFKSEHKANINSKAKTKWNVAYEEGLANAKNGYHKLALASFSRATEIDDQHANLHFEIGNTFFALKRYPDAAKSFRRAREEDVCPLRALTEMSTIVRNIAGNSDSPMIDFEAIVAQETLKSHGHNIPGRELFLDHVHPTIEGHKLLAVAVVERMAEEGIVNTSNNWKNRIIPKVTKRVEASLSRQKKAGALRNLAKVLNWAGKHDEAGRLALLALVLLPEPSKVDRKTLKRAVSMPTCSSRPGSSNLRWTSTRH
jgi:tetratricopeptide (TPR) repeat protein